MKGLIFINYRIYEKLKRYISKLNLNYEQYEKLIQAIAEALEI